MRSVSRHYKLSIFIAFLGGIFVAFIGQPLWKQAVISLNQNQMTELVYKCDSAMREHLIQKQRVALEPSAMSAQLLEAAEVALLDCQDYDLLQKRLTMWGLSENELSYMRLTAIEERASTLQEVIEIHEIRR